MTTRRKDIVAILVLLALWLLFFWRILTPIRGDQASIKQGDFSGQFVAFAAYQYDRITQGEIPPWNPYNNSGLPFIADTQAAVFYPPRLAAIALSRIAGGWTYHALELEMAFHVLAGSLMMYGLIRRMTRDQSGSSFGGLTGGIISSYGGFLTGYPMQQLAILEAAIWLPLTVLGAQEATHQQAVRWRWLIVSGFALGLSWMAGHPQTSWFLTYLVAAYLGYRIAINRQRWTNFVGSLALIGLVAGGMAAVQLFPGIEYLAHTARVDLTYEAKGNGFPFRDILQLLFPAQISLFSPLYIGITGLALVIMLPGFQRRISGGLFWLAVALVALAHSFGANSALFPVLYNTLPGLRYFRGQERAAYLIAYSLAILAGLVMAYLASEKTANEMVIRRIRQALWGLIIVCAAGIILSHTGWLGTLPEDALNAAVFSTLIAAAAGFLLWNIIKNPDAHVYQWLFIGLLVFDLFTINMDAKHTYDPIPPDEQIPMNAPPLIESVLADVETPFRVDGFRGLHDNYGSLYGVMDMRGISPLFLDGPFQLIEPEKVNPLAWELFAVRYVYSDWQTLPVNSDIIASGEDRFGPVNLHRLTDPRPFAHLIYDAEILDSDSFARALLRDPNFDARRTVILDRGPAIDLTGESPDSATAVVIHFAPENFTVTVQTSADAVLSLAHPDYPGWQAFIDNEPTEIYRAYGGLTAIAVPAGDHQIELIYAPMTYQIGGIISLSIWLGLGILGLFLLINRRKRDASIK